MLQSKPGRSGCKQEHKQNSPNLGTAFWPSPVADDGTKGLGQILVDIVYGFFPGCHATSSPPRTLMRSVRPHPWRSSSSGSCTWRNWVDCQRQRASPPLWPTIDLSTLPRQTVNEALMESLGNGDLFSLVARLRELNPCGTANQNLKARFTQPCLRMVDKCRDYKF